MMEIRRYAIILIIFLSLCLFNAKSRAWQQIETPYDEKKPQLNPELVYLETNRAESSKIDTLIQVLGIKPGMTILDLGAGSGQYTYKFAESLKGTGRVFATDIDASMVDYIKQQAQGRNLINLFSVLVNREGLDEFYKKNKFDLIFIAHTYRYLRNRVVYFKDLKNSLAKNGQLVIMFYKDHQKFSLDDISDLGGLVRQLSSEKPDGPFYSHLQESTRELLRQPLDNKTKELIKKAIVDEFNRITEDFSFLSHFLQSGSTLKKGIAFTPEERDHFELEFRSLKFEDEVLDNTGALDMNNKNMNKTEFSRMRTINTMLIVQKFRKYLYNGKPAPYLPGGSGHWLKMDTRIRELQSAGYKLKHQYDFVPFEMILIFTPNNDIRSAS